MSFPRQVVKRAEENATEMPAPPSYLSSLQVGVPLERPGVFGAPAFTTGFVKHPTSDSIWLSQNGLEGDGQGDKVHHGGPDKAVCVYSEHEYFRWSKELEKDLSPGAFGENFTVIGWTDESVCLGDRFRVGDGVLVEVSQPRAPCWKLAQIHQVKDLAYQMQTSGCTGWYLRVLSEGAVRSGDAIVRTAHPNPGWSILRVNQLVYDRRATVGDLTALADCEALSRNWRDKLAKRAQTNSPPDEQPRLRGPANG